MRGSFAQAATQRMAFYSGVGSELTHYDVDVDADALTKRGAVKMPGGIQYAWPSPSRKFLYVTSSTGGPGYSGNEHYLAAFRVGGDGELTQQGDMVKLRSRPINNSVDRSGKYVLVAYNSPSGISVHRIKADGSVGDEVPQPDNLEKGIYFHQVRATPNNKTVLVVARGNNPDGGKPEDPGSLHVYGFNDGVLSNLRKIQPNGGYGFGPRPSRGSICRSNGRISSSSTSSSRTAISTPSRCSPKKPWAIRAIVSRFKAPDRFTFIPTARSSISATARASRRRWDPASKTSTA
jgi:hypothetical protein